MTLLNEFQCEELRKLGLDNIKSLMDIIEILPEYIKEPEIGRFEYELIIRKMRFAMNLMMLYMIMGIHLFLIHLVLMTKSVILY